LEIPAPNPYNINLVIFREIDIFQIAFCPLRRSRVLLPQPKLAHVTSCATIAKSGRFGENRQIDISLTDATSLLCLKDFSSAWISQMNVNYADF